MNFEAVVKTLKSEFNASIEDSIGNRKLVSLDAAKFLGAMTLLHREMGPSARLIFVTASYVDNSLFWMAELFCSEQLSLSVRAKVPNGVALLSLRELWPHADWQEREAQELFGIQFKGASEFDAFLLRNARVEFPHRRQ